MDGGQIEREAQALAGEIAGAVETILDAAEAALRPGAADAAQAQLHRILEACVIGDIAHQRLARIGRLARDEAAPEGGLLDGPAAPGSTFDQDEVDRLIGSL